MPEQSTEQAQGSILRRIHIDDLDPGMYVEDVFTESGVLLLSANAIIRDVDQVQVLRRRGVTSLYINIRKGKDVDEFKSSTSVSVQLGTQNSRHEAEQRAQADEREEEYYRELDKAKDVHTKTHAITVDVLKSVKTGGTFSAREMRVAAEEIAESIMRNPDALVSLSQIRGYDEYTYVHSMNVGILVAALAHSMGCSADTVVDIGMGGLLHDIGKMKISESILYKPGKLTDAEYAQMKRHPEFGYQLLNGKVGISDTSKKVVLQHHERFNGGGYPFGLKGDRITEAGLIGAVADVYDALTSDRSYKKAWTPQKALALIFSGAESDYSRKIVENFTKHLGIYPVGSFVRLVSGELGVVIRTDRGNLLNPVVLMLYDRQGRRLARPVEYDLSSYAGRPDRADYRIVISVDPTPFGVNIGDFISSRPHGGA